MHWIAYARGCKHQVVMMTTLVMMMIMMAMVIVMMMSYTKLILNLTGPPCALMMIQALANTHPSKQRFSTHVPQNPEHLTQGWQ